MAVWKDIYNSQPPNGSLIWVHRGIYDCPPLWGTYDSDADILTCGENGWFLYNYDIWTWKPYSWSALKPFPVPSAISGWVDPWLHPPEDQQSVWVRRFGPNTAALQAVWQLANKAFLIRSDSAPLLPWQHVYRWKSRP